MQGTVFDVSGNKAYAPGGGYHGKCYHSMQEAFSIEDYREIVDMSHVSTDLATVSPPYLMVLEL
jgi:hypothetical protein